MERPSTPPVPEHVFSTTIETEALADGSVRPPMVWDACDRSARLGVRLLSADGAAVSLPERGRQAVRSVLPVGDWPGDQAAELVPLCERVVSGSEVQVIGGEEFPLPREGAAGPHESDAVSALAVPIPLSGGDGAGALVVYSKQRRDWSDEDKEALSELAATLGLSLVPPKRPTLLPASGSSFQAFVETSSEYVAVLSAGGGIRYLSAVAARRMGASAEALIGRSAWELVHPEEVPKAIRCFTERAREPGSSGYAEIRVRIGEADWGTFEVQLKNLLDDPAVQGMLVTARDLTAHRRAEDNRRRLQAIIEATPDFVATLDPRGRALFINPAGRRMIGIEEDAVTSLNIPDLFTQRETERILQDGIPAAARAGLWRSETALQNAEGGEIPVSQVLLAHRSPAGGLDFLSIIARDIRAQKRIEEALRSSEEHFRALIENGLDVIHLMDADGRVSYCSPSIQRVLGYSPDELIDSSAWDLIHPDDLEEAQARIRERIESSGSSDSLEAQVRHRDGTWRLFEMRAQNLLDHPAVRGIVINSRDITARKQAEEELEESREQLLQSQRMEAVGRLAGGVAHDFNNLLTAIKGFAELLIMEMEPDDPSRVFVSEIKKAGDRAVGLTRQLLAFSRKQVLQPRVLDIGEVVEQMEKMLRRLIGEDIYLETRSEVPLWRVRADPGQMEQVLLNLVVNARDAMPSGGRLQIEAANLTLASGVSTEQIELPPGQYVRLRVTDSGTGMDAETRARIFEPFFTTKEKGKGTGLGLSTVYGIVTQSGGFVEVESSPENGSMFHIYLPRVHEEVKVEPEPSGEAPAHGSETVFLVEDEAAVRSLVSRVLKRSGYTVIEARDGKHATEVISGYGAPVDLLLTDVVMPGMSGRDLAERLAPEYPEMKVLYMSGYTDDAIVHLGVLEADIAFIGKPFTPEVLLRQVRAVLDGQKPQHLS